MRDSADADEVHARLGDGADGGEIHAAAGLGLRASGDEGDGGAELVGGHVVEEDDVRAGVHGLGDLIKSVRFNFDFELRIARTGTLDGGGDGVRLLVAQGSEMVVLDENEIVEADAMIASAPAGDGVFLEAPPAGRGLARVENLGARATNRLDELRGERGDAGEALNKIEGGALGGVLR